MRIKVKVVGAVLGLALFAAGPAQAQVNPTQAGYSKPAGSIQETVSTGKPKSVPAASTSTSAPTQQVKAESGSLPFTGLQLGLIVGIGLMLVAMGIGVRRMARPRFER
jgi:hypothetical protein